MAIGCLGWFSPGGGATSVGRYWLNLVCAGWCWLEEGCVGRCWGHFFLAGMVCGGLCCLMSVAGWSRLVSVGFGRV